MNWVLVSEIKRQHLIVYRIPKDLLPWRTIVLPKEQALFDEVAGAIWGKKKAEECRQAFGNDYYQCDSPSVFNRMLYFQQLAQNLISETGISRFETDPLSMVDGRLHTGQEQNIPRSTNTEEGAVTDPLSTRHFPQRDWDQEDEDSRRSKPPIYLANWSDTSPSVVALMSTAIFGVVIAFLLSKPIVLDGASVH